MERKIDIITVRTDTKFNETEKNKIETLIKSFFNKKDYELVVGKTKTVVYKIVKE
jgi:hypothetical protein